MLNSLWPLFDGVHNVYTIFAQFIMLAVQRCKTCFTRLVFETISLDEGLLI